MRRPQPRQERRMARGFETPSIVPIGGLSWPCLSRRFAQAAAADCPCGEDGGHPVDRRLPRARSTASIFLKSRVGGRQGARLGGCDRPVVRTTSPRFSTRRWLTRILGDFVRSVEWSRVTSLDLRPVDRAEFRSACRTPGRERGAGSDEGSELSTGNTVAGARLPRRRHRNEFAIGATPGEGDPGGWEQGRPPDLFT
jgi:hypothetical protein